MQRKCNLSLYSRKSQGSKTCLQCDAQLEISSTPTFFCSQKCLTEWQLAQCDEKPSTIGAFRRAEIPKDESQAAAEADETSDDALWVKRAQHWENQTKPQLVRRKWARTKTTDPKPLILTGHGAQLRTDHGSLILKNGFTYYPQNREEWRLFPGDPDLPSRIILIDTNGYVTLDVIRWLSSQQIPLILLNWKGEVTSAIGGNGLAADPNLRQLQLAAQSNGRGLFLSTQLIKDKIKTGLATLVSLPVDAANREHAIAKSVETLRKLDGSLAEINSVRMLEAQAAWYYFGLWQGLELNWKGTGRIQIPPKWNFIGQRASFASSSNRDATHPVNAILNYSYALLENQVHIETLAAGLDPTIGYLHSLQPGRLALVYDLMEPLRPLIDRLVLRFVLSQWFTPKDFLLSSEGICRMHPMLTRRVAQLNVEGHKIKALLAQCVGMLGDG